MKPNFDFASKNELPYDQRSRFGAGDYYGIGEGPKHGKIRSSFMKIDPPSKASLNPPVQIAK